MMKKKIETDEQMKNLIIESLREKLNVEDIEIQDDSVIVHLEDAISFNISIEMF